MIVQQVSELVFWFLRCSTILWRAYVQGLVFGKILFCRGNLIINWEKILYRIVFFVKNANEDKQSSNEVYCDFCSSLLTWMSCIMRWNIVRECIVFVLCLNSYRKDFIDIIKFQCNVMRRKNCRFLKKIFSVTELSDKFQWNIIQINFSPWASNNSVWVKTFSTSFLLCSASLSLW